MQWIIIVKVVILIGMPVATLTSGDHMISISLGLCKESITSVVICQSNSTVLVWKESNSTITSSMEEYSYTTVPSTSGVLVSELVVNTSTFSIRSGPRRELRCCNEKPYCKSILLQYNGTCLGVIINTEDNTKINEFGSDHSDTLINSEPTTVYKQNNTPAGATLAIISCALVVIVVFLCASMVGILLCFHIQKTRNRLQTVLSDQEIGNCSQTSTAATRRDSACKSETTSLLAPEPRHTLLRTLSAPPSCSNCRQNESVIPKSLSEQSFFLDQ